MFKLASPKTPRILESTPEVFSLTTLTRTVFSASRASRMVSGKFTLLTTSPVVKKRMMVSAAMAAAASSASSVDAPRWGITTQRGWSHSSSSGKSVTYLNKEPKGEHIRPGKQETNGAKQTGDECEIDENPQLE